MPTASWASCGREPLADVIVIDLEKPHLQPMNDLVSNLVYCGKAADVER